MNRSQPSAWSYRLSPGLVLRTRGAPSPEAGDKALLVRAGDAFPPGHPTTRLSLDLLREALAAAPANSLLDVGCGAGVLALAGAALGVPRVVGVDIFLPAARATAKNARDNGLAGTVAVVQGSTECLKVPFALVAANLHWEVQLEKAPELHRLTAAGGRLILSGFRDNQEQGLLESYLKRGRSLRRRLVWQFHHPELPAEVSFNWVAWLLG